MSHSFIKKYIECELNMSNSFIKKYIAVSFATTLIAFYTGIWWAKSGIDGDYIEYKKNIEKCIESLDIELEVDEVHVIEIVPDEVDSRQSHDAIEIVPDEVDSMQSHGAIEIVPGQIHEVDSDEHIIDTENLFISDDSTMIPRLVNKPISWFNPISWFFG
jgi:short-subunit dehydrogenase involved in D-alanine esterification of teichoic acids